MENEKKMLLHEMFSEQAKKTPDRIAVVSGDGRQLTYSQLNEWTGILSIYLRIKGVTPDSIVGIYMEKCLEYTISYISILKAGGAYMPMDVSYPVTLLDDILADSKPVAIFADATLVQFIPKAQNVIVFGEGWLAKTQAEIAEYGVPPEPQPLTLDNLAYTVYSSGTTGKPKGIQCPHRGAVLSYSWRHEDYPYVPNEREACNIFFVWEMLRPLLQGVTMYIIPDSVIYDPHLLCEFLRKFDITRILFTPSLLEAVLDTEGLDVTNCMKAMRTIIFCGEVVTVGLLERCVKTLPHVKFVNLYSISESHDVACCDLSLWYKQEKDVKNKKFCPVGRLQAGVSVMILDAALSPQPVGVPGEIYIGGPTLARGYLNRPVLNAERFIKRPEAVSPNVGDRLYKAGDWGYMLSDGSFEICGRCDSMVKIRGYSIETQAIESALLELSKVNACVVVVMGEEGEDKYLVAYIVPEGKTSKKEIRGGLKKRLPFYMIPSYFIFLNSIPVLAASGKLDKQQLPPVSESEHELDEEGLPQTETEKALASLWADVLQLKAVDVHESFFDLGGHSLLAAKLLSKVQEHFGMDLAVKDLFIYSSVSAMAKLINSKTEKEDRYSPDMLEAPTLDLLKEVETHDQAMPDMDIQLRAFWRSMQYTEKWNKARVMLTGATGFLGAFILRDLLTNTKTHIFCLVRELPDRKGIDRVHDCLVEYGILCDNPKVASEEQRLLEARFKSRVVGIIGDVGLINMGLSEDDYTYLGTEIDLIIHAAAYVNLIYPYEALYSANVLGTQNVLFFACTSKIKPLHYVSTDGVFPPGLSDCGEGDGMDQHAANLDDGYSQSKWVAERLVHRAMNRGLPAVIYRLGNLGGDSKMAYWNAQDLNLMMIQGCLLTGAAPLVDWDVELTPVDFVSDLIVNFTMRMGLSLGKIFHVVNTKPMKFQWIIEWISAHGYPLKVVSFDNWKKTIDSSHHKSKSVIDLQKMIDSLVGESYLSKMSTYCQEKLDKVLAILGKKYPEINNTLLQTYIMNLARRGIIPKARRNTIMDKPLDGQVAIVTGSSSGIGASVAVHLARAGAKVAMAARREEMLQDIKHQIEQDGGIAIAVKCDVTNKEEVAQLVKHTECTLGPVQILVNNAGCMYYTMMKNLKEDEWESQVDINCKGVLNCIGGVLDGMLKRGKGHIVNMSSDAGRRGFAGLAVYSGTKFFVEGLSQGMRVELAQTGVKVTCIQPGDVKTELRASNTDTEAQSAYDGMSLTKILEPSDIARAVVYAVSQPEYVAVNEILIEPRGAPI